VREPKLCRLSLWFEIIYIYASFKLTRQIYIYIYILLFVC
jgi:hypothetical protein